MPTLGVLDSQMAFRSPHATPSHEMHHVDRRSKRDLSVCKAQSRTFDHRLDKLTFESNLGELDSLMVSKSQHAIPSHGNYHVAQHSMHDLFVCMALSMTFDLQLGRFIRFHPFA